MNIDISIHQQINCVKVEIETRESLYPHWVLARKRSQEWADREIRVMYAVLRSLEELRSELEAHI